MLRYLIILFTLVFLHACASSQSGGAYKRSETRTAQDIQMGQVEHVREVLIEGTKTNVGTAAGAAIGGVLGHGSSSNQTTRTVGGIAGAVVGGMAGAAAEEGLTRQKGYEITIKLDSGRVIAIVQAADEEFEVGDRVRVIEGGAGATRVSH
ncbi:MAG: glycine zipper 2TM domain-containing protein [Thiohalomonadaceae bacterium]